MYMEREVKKMDEKKNKHKKDRLSLKELLDIYQDIIDWSLKNNTFSKKVPLRLIQDWIEYKFWNSIDYIENKEKYLTEAYESGNVFINKESGLISWYWSKDTPT